MTTHLRYKMIYNVITLRTNIGIQVIFSFQLTLLSVNLPIFLATFSVLFRFYFHFADVYLSDVERLFFQMLCCGMYTA